MDKKSLYRMDVSVWSVERIVFLVAGVVVFLTALTAVFVDPVFVWLDGFFGLMLFFFSVTGYCPMAMLIHRLKGPLGKR